MRLNKKTMKAQIDQMPQRAKNGELGRSDKRVHSLVTLQI